MIYREHIIELFVNGKRVELESQKSLNLRFNNVLYDPEKITSNQAEYSFEFEVPSTPVNDKIFNYANNLSKLNKFHARWNAEVYADGTIIFEGSLTLNSYKNKMYKLNLVSVKSYSLEDIFGDDVMYDISGTREDQKWYIDFDGVSSINAYNASGNSEVMFPLVSYGVFQKVPDPQNSDSVANSYTSKFDIDRYNRWWVESFYPSLNMVETLRKCFEYKGYTVGGDLFNDEYLKDVYMSVNLADGQTPDYNLGNPRFGKVDLTISWQNPMDIPPSGIFDWGTTYGTVQDLRYPYLKSGDDYWDLRSGEAITVRPDFNFKKVRVYNMMSSADGGSLTINGSTYMFEPNENLIVIPSDGFYKIDISATTSLDTTSPITASQWVHDWDDHVTAMTMSVEEKDITFNPDYKITTPLEIQLVRNYDEDIELIKGKNNFRCHDGYPDNETEMNHGRYSNYSSWYTCFPHEKLGATTLPTNPTDGSQFDTFSIYDMYTYVYRDGELMAYDSFVNPNFICGWTTMGNKLGGGCASVIKNGYSWNKEHADRHDAMYTQNGYLQGTVDASYNYVWTNSNHNKNAYIDSPTPYYSQTNNSSNGRITCLVYLKKNDVLQLFGIHRDYSTTSGSSVSYQTSANVHLTIQAASPNSYADLIRRNYGYNSPIEFDDKLRLSNFLSKEKKVSEWIQNVKDAFNLDILQSGKTVTINTKKKFDRKQVYAVDIDNRVNTNEAEASMINYPKSMAVKYKIDTDEWGAENSVLEQEDGEAKMNEADWKKYIDSGFTVIELNDDSYVTSTSDKNLQFSYTWYDNFNWYEVDYEGVQNPYLEMTLRLPVISKYTYMIDGYNYEESMQHDGYGLAQRFWFKPKNHPYMNGDLQEYCYVWTETYPKEKVYLYTPSNVSSDGVLNLSYKMTEKSLLQKYFNIGSFLASNYVEVEVYLNPAEYNAIKNGCYVHFDSDIYLPVELQGYDPTNFNPTTLKMIKKIV